MAFQQSAGEVGEQPQRIQISLVEAVVRRGAEATEGAVEPAIAEAQRNTEVRADRQGFGHRHGQRLR